ncbi:MAG: LPXTG cell wall anchor domain-containing protein [Thermoleophilia bacterium]
MANRRTIAVGGLLAAAIAFVLRRRKRKQALAG